MDDLERLRKDLALQYTACLMQLRALEKQETALGGALQLLNAQMQQEQPDSDAS